VLTTLGRNDTALSQGALQQLKVRLLEQSLGRALRVGAVSDDNIELALLVVEELEAITNVGGDVGVLVANGHTGEVLLGKTDDSLVNVAEDGLLDTLVLDDLTEDTAVTTTDDEDLLGVGVRVHGQVGDHLLVRELVTLGALDDIVEDKDHAVVGRLEDEDILVLGLLVVNDLVDLEGHGLARPPVGDLAEPAICLLYEFPISFQLQQYGALATLDGGVSDFAAHCDRGGFRKDRNRSFRNS
jgi:hypothetical protein